jgi:hypothetical protein
LTLANWISSCTDAAATAGCTTNTLGAVTINVIGAKSRMGSNGNLPPSRGKEFLLNFVMQ